MANFVFMDNYVRLFLDDDIFVIAVRTLIFAAITGPTSYLMSFMMAWFINELAPKSGHCPLIIYNRQFPEPSTLSGRRCSQRRIRICKRSLIYQAYIDSDTILQKQTFVMPLCIVVAL